MQRYFLVFSFLVSIKSQKIKSNIFDDDNFFKLSKINTRYQLNNTRRLSEVYDDFQSNDSLQFCSFFNNRAPQAQPALKNCTWFAENSCCLQHEIDVSFSRVKPLIGASEDCQRYTNYLMCYVCSPDQNVFYKKERLTVCESFCDLLYEACKFAYLKGNQVAYLYSTGTDFCLSRRFLVDHHNCFRMQQIYFEAMKAPSTASNLNFKNIYLLFICTFLSLCCFNQKYYSFNIRKYRKSQNIFCGLYIFIAFVMLPCIQPAESFRFDDVLSLRNELSKYFKNLEVDTVNNEMYKNILSSQIPFKKTGYEILNDIKKTLDKFFAEKRSSIKELSSLLKDAHNQSLSQIPNLSNVTNAQTLLLNSLERQSYMKQFVKSKLTKNQLITPEKFDVNSQEVINFYNFTDKFDELAKNFVDQYIRSIYFASSTGLMRMYSNLTLKSPFEPRSQAWYMGVKEAPSHVVIIIDTSFTDDMDGFERSKRITKLLLNSLASHQRVAVISSASRAWFKKGVLQDAKATVLGCQKTRLMKSTNGNKKMLMRAVQMLKPLGSSNHKEAFKLAFDLLEGQKKDHPKYLDCRSVILFVTDGEESEYNLRCSEGYYQFNENNERIFQKGETCRYRNEELLEGIQWRQRKLPGTKANIFTFLTTKLKSSHALFPGKLACQNNGAMSRVFHNDDLFGQMSPYFDYIRAREYSMDPILTGPYESIIDGEPVLTISIPVLPGHNINTKRIIGVLGMDISLSAFESLVHDYHDITTVINLNDGSALIHPLLPKSYEGMEKWMDIPIMDLEMYEEKDDDYDDDDGGDDDDDDDGDKNKSLDRDTFPHVMRMMMMKMNGSHVIRKGVKEGVVMKGGYVLWKEARSAVCFFDRINNTHLGILLKAYTSATPTTMAAATIVDHKPSDRLFEVTDEAAMLALSKKEHLFKDKSTQWLHTLIVADDGSGGGAGGSVGGSVVVSSGGGVGSGVGVSGVGVGSGVGGGSGGSSSGSSGGGSSGDGGSGGSNKSGDGVGGSDSGNSTSGGILTYNPNASKRTRSIKVGNLNIITNHTMYPGIPITLDATSIVLTPSAFCQAHTSRLQYTNDKLVVQQSINKRPRDDDKLKEERGDGDDGEGDEEEDDEGWYEALLGKEKNCMLTKNARLDIQFSKMLFYPWKKGMMRNDKVLRSIYMASINGVIRHYPGLSVPEYRIRNPMRYKWFIEATLHPGELSVINNRASFTTSDHVVTISKTVNNRNLKIVLAADYEKPILRKQISTMLRNVNNICCQKNQHRQHINNNNNNNNDINHNYNNHNNNNSSSNEGNVTDTMFNGTSCYAKCYLISDNGEIVMSLSDDLDRSRFNDLQHQFHFVFKSLGNRRLLNVQRITKIHRNCSGVDAVAGGGGDDHNRVRQVNDPLYNRACMTITKQPYIDLHKLRKLGGTFSGFSSKKNGGDDENEDGVGGIQGGGVGDDPCYTGVFYLSSVNGTNLLLLTLIDVDITKSLMCHAEVLKTRKTYENHEKPLCPLHRAYYAARSNSTTCPQPRFVSLYCQYNSASSPPPELTPRHYFVFFHLSIFFIYLRFAFINGVYLFDW